MILLCKHLERTIYDNLSFRLYIMDQERFDLHVSEVMYVCPPTNPHLPIRYYMKENAPVQQYAQIQTSIHLSKFLHVNNYFLSSTLTIPIKPSPTSGHLPFRPICKTQSPNPPPPTPPAPNFLCCNQLYLRTHNLQCQAFGSGSLAASPVSSAATSSTDSRFNL